MIASPPLFLAVAPGEIACLRAMFDPLLYRRAEPHYYAFDCLWLDGEDLRDAPLLERKRILRQLVPPQPSSLLYVAHFVETGTALYRAACDMDLEASSLSGPQHRTAPSRRVACRRSTR